MDPIIQRDPAQEAARMKSLTETSPDTLMGKVLRTFWHPVALSSSVEAGKAKAVRLLGEDLALYRGESGTAHLIANRCAHRLTKLHTGWIEGEQLRCMYHGWKYDATGQCVERPAERAGSEAGIRITSYTVHEYCGLVFAWMGEGEAPPFDLPRKAVFERDDVLLFQRKEIWPCNWLQHAENSLDAVHVSFAHQIGKVGVFGEAITTSVPELSYEETQAGIRQTAMRSEAGKSQARVSDWTFPYANHVSIPPVKASAPWMEVSNWMVPIDDTQTIRISLIAAESTSPASDADLREYFESCEKYNPRDHHDDLFEGKYPEDPLIRLTSAQDYVALIGQGAIVDRTHERLGASDRGIAMLRRIMWREMDALRSGRPTKQWCRISEPLVLFTSSEAPDATPTEVPGE